jgi:hypothetical protein
MAMLEPNFRKKVQEVIVAAHDEGFDLRVAETFRSQARQIYFYFRAGFTQLKQVGVHHFGLACDFNLFIDGKYETDGQKYAFLRDFEKKYRIISGDLCGTPFQKRAFFDWDHIQGVTVLRQASLRSMEAGLLMLITTQLRIH